MKHVQKLAALGLALCAVSSTLASRAEAQSYSTRTIGFEGDCNGTPFTDNFSLLGYRDIPTTQYAACGIQSIITTASGGGNPQVLRPSFLPIAGTDGSIVLAGGTEGVFATGNLQFVFSPPVNEVSLRALDLAQTNALTITALDALERVLDVQKPARDGDEISSYSYTSPSAASAPVVRLKVEYLPSAFDTWYIDRLRFNAWHCGDSEVEAGEACDDANARACDGCNNSCQTSITGCLAGGTCIANGSTAPGSFGCAVCNTALPVPPGGDLAPAPRSAGTACDDGLFCSATQSCNGAGVCAGVARDCNDGAGCTTDTCNEGTDACDHTLTTGGCAIGASCVNPGAANPLNPCEVCNPALSTTAYSPAQAGTSCANPSCSAGNLTTASLCDGAGSCNAGTTAACPGGSNCRDAVSCLGPCTRDDQCLVGSYCAAGVCKPKGDTGSDCSADNQCSSTVCADGKCCNTRCDGTCESCALPNTLGTCSPYTRGSDPESECGTARFCSGARTCIIDTQPPGASCTDGDFCASGNCVDGVCCDSKCDGTCEACNLDASPGVCAPYQSGVDPEAECGAGKLCSGKRACVIDTRPDGESCDGNASCASGHCVDGVCCNAACDRSCESCRVADKVGVCTAADFGTDPAGDCGAARFCAAPGVCIAEDRPDGVSCEGDAYCKSGHCVDGLCCDSPCEGTCVSCAVAGAEGVCTAFAAGTDPADECSGEAVCDGISRCVSFETRGNGLCAVKAAPSDGQGRALPYGLFALGLLALVLRRRRR